MGGRAFSSIRSPSRVVALHGQRRETCRQKSPPAHGTLPSSLVSLGWAVVCRATKRSHASCFTRNWDTDCAAAHADAPRSFGATMDTRGYHGQQRRPQNRVLRTSCNCNARRLSECGMESFQPLADFTGSLDSTGLQNLRIFTVFASDRVSSNQSSALRYIIRVENLGKHVHPFHKMNKSVRTSGAPQQTPVCATTCGISPYKYAVTESPLAIRVRYHPWQKHPVSQCATTALRRGW